MFATIDGINLHYQVEGMQTGAPLVFINSLGTDFRIWDAVMSHFVDRFRVVRYDKRGHGLSDVPRGPYRIRDHANDLLGLLDHLNVDKAALVGISVGGQIALDFAATHPEQVQALVVCDTGAVIGTAKGWNDRIDAVRANGMAQVADAVVARWLTPAFATQRPAEFKGYLAMLSRTPATGYVATCEAIRDADLTDSARSIVADTLVVCGDQDTSTPPELNRALADLIPHAQFALIENAAHLPCIEQPQALAHEITRFLAEIGLTTDDGRPTTEDAPSVVHRPSSVVYERGMQVRRAVLGDAHVDRAEANKTDFDADFQRFITEMAWGSVWARPQLDRKTRHLLTIALMAALGKEHELAMHIRATQNTGVTPDDVKEVFLHVAVYAGVPAANAAFAVAKKVYAELEEK